MRALIRRFWRSMTVAMGIVALLSACKAEAPPPKVPNGTIVTEYDRRDTEQCMAQAHLAWCRAACERDETRKWCHG